MPFIRITTNAKIDESQESLMNMELGVAIECIEGKSESWLMLEYRDSARMAFGGSDVPCAMVEVDLLGEATAEDKDALTASMSAAVNVVIGVPPDRIYVRYLETEFWGYNGHNF